MTESDPPPVPGSLPGLDRLLLDPTRLSVMAVLGETDWCDFGFVRDTVGLSDSALSKQLATLRAEGYLDQQRTYLGRVPRTSLCATDRGRQRLLDHLAALQGVVDRTRRGARPASPTVRTSEDRR